MKVSIVYCKVVESPVLAGFIDTAHIEFEKLNIDTQIVSLTNEDFMPVQTLMDSFFSVRAFVFIVFTGREWENQQFSKMIELLYTPQASKKHAFLVAQPTVPITNVSAFMEGFRCDFSIVDDYTDVINKISEKLQSIKSSEEVEKLEQQEKIREGEEKFIDPAIKWLDDRKKALSQTATFWNLLGFFSLISGALISYIFIDLGTDAIDSVNQSKQDNSVEWGKVVFLSVKSLIIIALLVAASRYSFNLSKTYVDQAIKNGDRRHAISFGKFYLQLFGGNVKPEEVKEVFKDWNLSSESPFIKLDSSEHDPKLIETLAKALEPYFKKGKE